MRHARVLLAVLVAVLVLVPAFAEEKQGRGRRAKKKTKYRVTSWGAIQGTCRLSHAMEPRTVQYKCVKKEPRSGASLHSVHDPKTLTLDGCLVFLEGIREGKDWPPEMRSKARTHTIELHRTDFAPRISWVREKTQLAFRPVNAEEDFNVHGYFQGMQQTVSGIATGAGSLGVTTANFFVSKDGGVVAPGDAFLKKAGKYLLKDDCRPSMVGHVHAFQNPYVSGPTLLHGRYEIADVPPGTYTLVCWHESLKFEPQVINGTVAAYHFGPAIRLTKEVVVEPGKTVTVDWTIDVPESLRKKAVSETEKK